MQAILAYLFAAVLLLSAFYHIYNPAFYAPLIPSFIPEKLANIASTIAETIIAILLIVPSTRHLGGLGFMLLMLAFLPLHVWDLVRERSIIGSKIGSAIRLVIQFVIIYAGWWLWKK